MNDGASAEAECAPGDDLDTGLVRGLKERSGEACAELYRRFAAPIHWFVATQMSGDAEAAEDLLVETLADAVNNIRHFSARGSTFSAWLYGIARRHVSTEMRRRNRRKSVPSSQLVSIESVGDVSGDNDLAHDAAARLEAQRRVRDLADVLSDLEMTALILSYVQELSVKEVGRVIGRSERAVHSILHRARRKARGRLVDYDV